jgi:hypothetical protein
MTEIVFASEDHVDKPERPPRRWVLPWLLLLGFVVFEATAQPVLGVTVVCLKFGWENFRTAFWLRRVDPDHRRGRACFWLFVAFGLLKTALAASFIFFALAIVVPEIRKRQGNAVNNAPPVEFMVAGLTVMAGVVLSSLATCAAVFKAWRGRLRLWVDRSVDDARRQETWPPPNPRHAHVNQARILILTALITISTILMLILVPSFLVPLFMVIGQVNQIFATSAIALMMIVLSGFVLGIRDSLSRSLANCPSDCWGNSSARLFGTDQK